MAKSNEPLNVVVLGASFAGLSVAHHFLDPTLSRLRKTSNAPNYRLVIISPSTHIYWNIGAPRALVAPGLLKTPDIFVPIEPGYRRHKDANVVFIQGLAVGWDTDARTVKIAASDVEAQKRACRVAIRRSAKRQSQILTTTSSLFMSDDEQELHEIRYHALIVATGTSAHPPLLSLHGHHEKTLAALKESHGRLHSATSIVVCGGGPSGVETAGQSAMYLNQHHAFSTLFSGRRQKNVNGPSHKQITLVMGTSRALPALPPKIGVKAEKQLRGLGVRLLKDVRVTKVLEDWGDQGKTNLTLSDNTTMLADVYFTGVLCLAWVFIC